MKSFSCFDSIYLWIVDVRQLEVIIVTIRFNVLSLKVLVISAGSGSITRNNILLRNI
jgi:hypothetical protein